jgi:hypothetical protein
MQIYINQSYPARADMEDFSTMISAARLLDQGYGYKTASETMLQLAGLKSIPSFLWRSPLFDSVDIVSGADKLHQDWLGGAKKLQRFLLGVVSGSLDKKEQLNLWMTRLRDNGVAGLISDTKLMTMAQMQVRPSVNVG